MPSGLSVLFITPATALALVKAPIDENLVVRPIVHYHGDGSLADCHLIAIAGVHIRNAGEALLVKTDLSVVMMFFQRSCQPPKTTGRTLLGPAGCWA